jgi:hypothetical protein
MGEGSGFRVQDEKVNRRVREVVIYLFADHHVLAV